MFLSFICLALPDDSPFWTATENEGFWGNLGEKPRITVLENPGLVLVNHSKTGASEIIPGKVYYDDPNYSKLICYTHFPWEDHDPRGGTSMEYSFHSLDPRDVRGDDINFCLTGATLANTKDRSLLYFTSQSMVFNGVHEGVIYRQVLMRRPPNNGVGYIIDLADIIIPGGVIRVDRSRMAFEHELTQGHFGMPHIDGNPAEVRQFEKDGRKVITASINGRKTALIIYEGWDSLQKLTHTKHNAETDERTVIYAYRKRTAKNPPMELMISALVHKTDDSEWTDEELSTVGEIRILDVTPEYAALGTGLTLCDGSVRKIYYPQIDGNRRC